MPGADRPVVGWYVHAHGRGHLHRAATVARALAEEHGLPVIGLSALPDPGGPFAGWLQLDRDDEPPTDDVTAAGTLHWAPSRHPGLRTRMAQLAAWVEQNLPMVVVVDVSVEITLFLRLMGVPVVVAAMPGDRDEPVHRLGYAVAERVLAFWPREVLDPPWLAGRADHVGAVSRFDGRVPVARSGSGGQAVLLSGAGGSTLTAADVAALERATPGWAWQVLGGPGEWSADPWPVLSSADVVVTHAGQNALAEVAAARRPAVVVPGVRPFAEQQRAAEALGAAGIAVVAPSWPEPAAWPGLLQAALDLGGDGWARWSTGHGASDAARVVAEVAR